MLKHRYGLMLKACRFSSFQSFVRGNVVKYWCQWLIKLCSGLSAIADEPHSRNGSTRHKCYTYSTKYGGAIQKTNL